MSKLQLTEATEEGSVADMFSKIDHELEGISRIEERISDLDKEITKLVKVRYRQLELLDQAKRVGSTTLTSLKASLAKYDQL